MSRIVEEIVLPALQAIQRVDCPVPKCYANASGTGRLLHIIDGVLDHWYVEFRCPDCGELHHVSSRRIDVLVRDVLAADPSQRDEVARAWVAEGWQPRWQGTHWG